MTPLTRVEISFTSSVLVINAKKANLPMSSPTDSFLLSVLGFYSMGERRTCRQHMKNYIFKTRRERIQIFGETITCVKIDLKTSVTRKDLCTVVHEKQGVQSRPVC